MVFRYFDIYVHSICSHQLEIRTSFPCWFLAIFSEMFHTALLLFINSYSNSWISLIARGSNGNEFRWEHRAHALHNGQAEGVATMGPAPQWQSPAKAPDRMTIISNNYGLFPWPYSPYSPDSSDSPDSSYSPRSPCWPFGGCTWLLRGSSTCLAGSCLLLLHCYYSLETRLRYLSVCFTETRICNYRAKKVECHSSGGHQQSKTVNCPAAVFF